jgi:hypothetical protein
VLKGQYWPVIPDRSLTGSGIQGNALRNPGHDPHFAEMRSCPRIRAISLIRAGAEAPPLPDTVEPVGADHCVGPEIPRSRLTPRRGMTIHRTLTRSTGGASAEAPEDTARRGCQASKPKSRQRKY